MKYNRVQFLKLVCTLPALSFLTACSDDRKTSINTDAIKNLNKDPEAMSLSLKMGKEQVFTMLDQRAALAMERSHNCAQSTFLALSEQFGLGGDEVLKALTPLPGIAESGQTCGAITGALMAMGLIYGRDRLEDWGAYRKSLVPTNAFVTRFETELGSTLCCNIQDMAFGKSYNLMDPEELRQFQSANATTKCTQVVQKAVRIAADIILENAKNSEI